MILAKGSYKQVSGLCTLVNYTIQYNSLTHIGFHQLYWPKSLIFTYYMSKLLSDDNTGID